jgi:hypothetical protein
LDIDNLPEDAAVLTISGQNHIEHAVAVAEK